MKCVLGKKKQKICESIAGKKFQICYTNGTRLPHHIVECWIDELNADIVNMQNGAHQPYIRHGHRQRVPPPE